MEPNEFCCSAALRGRLSWQQGLLGGSSWADGKLEASVWLKIGGLVCMEMHLFIDVVLYGFIVYVRMIVW